VSVRPLARCRQRALTRTHRGSIVRAHEAGFEGSADSLSAVVQPELHQDPAQVGADRGLAHYQMICDHRIGEAVRGVRIPLVVSVFHLVKVVFSCCAVAFLCPWIGQRFTRISHTAL
jgi:hypothetical protein